MKKICMTVLCTAALFITCAAANASEAQMKVLKEHFPDGIMDKDGNAVDLAKLEGKAVGIYFSAHWCGPCRAFTPSLVKFRDENNEQIEVVFVSSDRSPEDQKKYMEGSEMKWYTMEHKSPAADALKKKYEVKGIPAFVLLKSTGELLTKSGRSLVTSGVDAKDLAHPDVAMDVEIEEYLCGKCTKMHKREVVKGIRVGAQKEAAPATAEKQVL